MAAIQLRHIQTETANPRRQRGLGFRLTSSMNVTSRARSRTLLQTPIALRGEERLALFRS